MNKVTITQLEETPFFYKAANCLSWCLPIFLLISRTSADLSLVAVDLIFLARCHCHNDWAWLKASWVKCCLVFFVYLVLVNVPLSMSPLSSLGYAIFFLRWPLFAVALSEWLFKSHVHIRQSLIALVVAIVFIASDTWYQYLVGHDVFGYTICCDQRLTGPFKKPLVGIMLVRDIFLSLSSAFVFHSLKSPHKKLLFMMFILLIGMLTIFVSGERMAFILGLFGFITILCGFWMQYKFLRLLILSGGVMLFLVILLACTLNTALTERMILSAIDKLMHFPESDYGLVFKAALGAWQENWLFGSGLHTYKQHCESLEILKSTEIFCSHAHNLYLQIGTETGIVGLMLFCTIIVAIYSHALKNLIRCKDWLNAAIAFSILNLSFWPLIGGISILNNWVASLTWFGVGWSISIVQINYKL